MEDGMIKSVVSKAHSVSSEKGGGWAESSEIRPGEAVAAIQASHNAKVGFGEDIHVKEKEQPRFLT